MIFLLFQQHWKEPIYRLRLEYRHMPKWLKEIYHHVYEQNPIRFAAFLEQAINHPKDFLKKALKRNGTTIHDLTEYQLLKELNRRAFFQ